MKSKQNKHEAQGRQNQQSKNNIEDKSNNLLLYLYISKTNDDLSQGEDEHQS